MAFRRGRRRRRSESRFTYSRWDGTQKVLDLDPDDLLNQMVDDLVYDGDPNSALRRMMLDGFRDRNGQELQGLREILDRLRRERQERLERFDLGGVYDEIAGELREVVDTERQALQDLLDQARNQGDQRRQEV